MSKHLYMCESIQHGIEDTFYGLHQKYKILSNYLAIDIDWQFLPCGECIVLDLLLRDALKVAADILRRVGNPHALLRIIRLLLLGLPDVVLHLQLKKFSLSFAKLVGSDGWRRICHPRIGFLRKILLSRIDESCLSPKETDPGRARWSSWYGRASWLNLEEDLKLNIEAIFNWNFISPNRESVWIFEKTWCHRYLKEMQSNFFMVEASFKYVRVRENNEKKLFIW